VKTSSLDPGGRQRGGELLSITFWLKPHGGGGGVRGVFSGASSTLNMGGRDFLRRRRNRSRGIYIITLAHQSVTGAVNGGPLDISTH